MSQQVSIKQYATGREDQSAYEKIANTMDLYGYKSENLIQILHACLLYTSRCV